MRLKVIWVIHFLHFNSTISSYLRNTDSAYLFDRHIYAFHRFVRIQILQCGHHSLLKYLRVRERLGVFGFQQGFNWGGISFVKEKDRRDTLPIVSLIFWNEIIKKGPRLHKAFYNDAQHWCLTLQTSFIKCTQNIWLTHMVSLYDHFEAVLWPIFERDKKKMNLLSCHSTLNIYCICRDAVWVES